jgi:hypothetical protein
VVEARDLAHVVLVKEEGISNTGVVLMGEIPNADSHRYDISATSEMGSLYPTMPNLGSPEWKQESRLQKSAQDDKWSFCLTAGTLCPTNQERQ